MRILFHVVSKNTIYAGRSIYTGYKNAFEDLGHKFKLIDTSCNLEKAIEEFIPDIFFTFLGSYSLKFHNFEQVKKIKKMGALIFVNMSFWNSFVDKPRIIEFNSLSTNPKIIKIIKSGDFGDVYFNTCEQDDKRMEGFEKITRYKHYTIPLAADKIICFPQYFKKFKADISYIGTNLPGKREFVYKNVLPLKKQYDLKIYGQDWNFFDKTVGTLSRTGWYFKIPFLKKVQKPKLSLEDERKIYNSSLISINVHEKYQIQYGGDCNERTFKIPLCGGFEICDNVSCVNKYFKDGKEIIIAKNNKDWLEKIVFFIKNPEKRIPIIEAGRDRVLKDHTYHNRVRKFIEIYKKIK